MHQRELTLYVQVQFKKWKSHRYNYNSLAAASIGFFLFLSEASIGNMGTVIYTAYLNGIRHNYTYINPVLGCWILGCSSAFWLHFSRSYGTEWCKDYPLKAAGIELHPQPDKQKQLCERGSVSQCSMQINSKFC